MNPHNIKTNRVPRPLVDDYGMTAKELAWFDWVSPENRSTGFFRFKGELYHLSQFLRMEDPYWHGVLNTSMTTGVLVHAEPDGEAVVVGTFCH